jgi:hypothetical protein
MAQSTHFFSLQSPRTDALPNHMETRHTDETSTKMSYQMTNPCIAGILLSFNQEPENAKSSKNQKFLTKPIIVQ